MKSKLYSYLLISTGIVLFSCKTASKLYEKGKYDEALMKYEKSLDIRMNLGNQADIDLTLKAIAEVRKRL